MSMTTKIHTMMQHSKELAARKAYAGIKLPGMKAPIPLAAFQVASAFVESVPVLPHYVVDTDLINAVLNADPFSQIRALHEAGVMHPPHDAFLIEVQEKDNAREFFTIDVHPGKFEYEIMITLNVLFGDDETGVPMAAFLKFDPENENLFTLAFVKDLQPESEENLWIWHDRILLIYVFSLLMRQIKGVAAEKVAAPEKLNKQRRAKGKVEIPEYTRLYIGSVEDRDGNSHAYSGRTMRVHLRAGHTRNQHYGKGNAMTKLVFIQPTLVNYNPGDEVPVPRRIVRMAN